MLGTWLHKKTYWFRCIQCIMAKTEDDKPTHLPTILWNWQLWDVYCYPDDKAAADLRSVFGPYLHSSLSSAFTGPSIKDPHCSLLKTWPLRSVTQPNTTGGLFYSPSICVYVLIAQDQYVHTGMDTVPWWREQGWFSKRSFLPFIHLMRLLDR